MMQGFDPGFQYPHMSGGSIFVEENSRVLGLDCGVLMLVFVAVLTSAPRLYPKLVQMGLRTSGRVSSSPYADGSR
jgi:hypothetical protein